MAWLTTKGFNFRDTSGYVIDGANQHFVGNVAGDGQYPSTNTIGGDSVTYGWDVITVTRDRDNTVSNKSLAGLHFWNTGTSNATFRIDLPATGNYKIRLAVGDMNFDQNNHWVNVQDNGSTLFNVGGGTVDTVAGHFLDANGNDYSATNWSSSNTQRTVTMTSTILQVVIRSNSGTPEGLLAHIEVEQVSGVILTATTSSFTLSGTSALFRVGTTTWLRYRK